MAHRNVERVLSTLHGGQHRRAPAIGGTNTKTGPPKQDSKPSAPSVATASGALAEDDSDPALPDLGVETYDWHTAYAQYQLFNNAAETQQWTDDPRQPTSAMSRKYTPIFMAYLNQVKHIAQTISYDTFEALHRAAWDEMASRPVFKDVRRDQYYYSGLQDVRLYLPRVEVDFPPDRPVGVRPAQSDPPTQTSAAAPETVQVTTRPPNPPTPRTLGAASPAPRLVQDDVEGTAATVARIHRITAISTQRRQTALAQPEGSSPLRQVSNADEHPPHPTVEDHPESPGRTHGRNGDDEEGGDADIDEVDDIFHTTRPLASPRKVPPPATRPITRQTGTGRSPVKSALRNPPTPQPQAAPKTRARTRAATGADRTESDSVDDGPDRKKTKTNTGAAGKKKK